MPIRFVPRLVVLATGFLFGFDLGPAHAAPSDPARRAGDPRLDEAAAALRGADPSRASTLAESVLSNDPDDTEALVLLARAARAGGGDLFVAETRLDAAAARAKETDRGQLLLELGLVRLARGQSHAIEGRGTRSTIIALFRDAISALNAARGAGASSDALTVGLAEAHEWAEEPAAAETILREAIEANGDSIALRRALAMLLFRQPDGEAEARDLARFVLDRSERVADHVDLLLALGRADLFAGAVERAFESYGAILAEWPGLQAVYDDIWDSTSGRRRFDLAEKILSLAIARFPADSKAPYYRGHSRLAETRFGEAASDFSEALAREPGFREARLGLAEARRRAGDRAGSAAAIGAILAVRPDDAAALDALRDVATEMAFAGNDDAARPHFETLTRARPADREARINWAVASARCGLMDESRRILEDGLALDPRDARLRNELGISHEASGRFDEAEREYRAALEDGFQFDAAENLAFLLLRSDRRAEAVPILREVLRRDPTRIRSALAYERTTRAE